MDTVHDSLQFNNTFHLLLNALVVSQMSAHYSVCVIRGYQDDIRLDFPRATLNLLLDEGSSMEAFDRRLIRAIDAGCEGFVVTGNMLFSFLDSFRSAHEGASYRASNKRIIALTSLEAIDRDRLINHDVMEAAQNILFIVPNSADRFVELYTTELLPLDPRGITVKIIRLERFVLKSTLALPILADYFPDKLSDMQGRRVRVGTVPYPPCSVVKEVPLGRGNARSLLPKNHSLEADGTELLIFVELCRLHNCALEIDLLPDSAWGVVYPNGSSDGLIGAVIDRRVDATAAAIYRWYFWYDHTWFSVYTGRSGVSIFVQRPQLLPHWQTPFLSFPPSLWLMVSVTFCAGTMATFITERARQQICQRNHFEQRYQLHQAVFFMFSLYVEQSTRLRNDLVAGTVLLAFLLFGGFMVGNSYAGALSCVMTIPRYEKAINTREEFTATGMTWVGTSIIWTNSLAMSEQPDIVTLRNKYEVHDASTLAAFVHTRTDIGYVHERLQFGSYGLEPYIDTFASGMLQPLKEEIFWEFVISACSKTWPMMGMYDDFVLRVQQAGLLRYWEEGSTFRVMGQEIQRNLANVRGKDISRDPIKLSISHFLGVFFMLFVGHTMAILTFIAETLVFRLTSV